VKNVITKLTKPKYTQLGKKIRSLGYPEEDITTILYHIDKLANIIIDSYITSKEKKI
jgi:hypothetical protein